MRLTDEEKQHSKLLDERLQSAQRYVHEMPDEERAELRAIKARRKVLTPEQAVAEVEPAVARLCRVVTRLAQVRGQADSPIRTAMETAGNVEFTAAVAECFKLFVLLPSLEWCALIYLIVPKPGLDQPLSIPDTLTHVVALMRDARLLLDLEVRVAPRAELMALRAHEEQEVPWGVDMWEQTWFPR